MQLIFSISMYHLTKWAKEGSSYLSSILSPWWLMITYSLRWEISLCWSNCRHSLQTRIILETWLSFWKKAMIGLETWGICPCLKTHWIRSSKASINTTYTGIKLSTNFPTWRLWMGLPWRWWSWPWNKRRNNNNKSMKNWQELQYLTKNMQLIK